MDSQRRPEPESITTRTPSLILHKLYPPVICAYPKYPNLDYNPNFKSNEHVHEHEHEHVHEHAHDHVSMNMSIVPITLIIILIYA